MTSKQLKTLGEFGLIDSIKKMTTVDRSVILGIGDDTAILRDFKGKELLLTTDMLIEDRHFRRSDATGYQIGWKAMAVNISDIAAMGGTPAHAVISIGLSKNLSVSFVKDIYKGLQAAAKKFKINVVGGDTNSSEKIVISIALLGFCARNSALKRSGAKPGDVIFVTGFLGGSYASKKHLIFTPRIAESRFLTKNFNIHSMMDISDGLASDIHRIAKASGVGAVLSSEAIPVSPLAKSVDQALSEGEDFELLFTLSPKEAARLTLSEQAKKFTPFHPVGKIVSKRDGVRLVRANKGSEIINEKGFDHFRD